MPPGSLQVGIGGQSSINPSFVQQGQVDWVAFGNTVYSASLSIMQRLSGAGVQPITQGGGLALGTRFKLGDVGRRRMDDALRNLQGIAGFDDIIYYGFGLQSLVNTLAETQAGINCIALCSCLADMHSEPMAARVLAALWRVEAFPEEFEPSHSQFLRLIRTCSGVVLRTTFGHTVDVILGDLGRYRGKVNFKSHISAADVEDLAKALHGLFKLSNGSINRISIIGGAESIFIAALATWLFDFPTYVQDENGTLLFTSATSEEAAQVVVRYGEFEHHSKAVLTSTTYVLRPHEQHEIFVEMADMRILNLIVRTAWDGCLFRVFGALYRELIGLKRYLANFLGGVARISTALARSEPDAGKFSRKHYIDFTETSYGLGFVATVTHTFPELGRLDDFEETMQKVAAASFQDAYKCVEDTTSILRKLCGCDLCQNVPGARGVVATSSTTGAPCIVVLAMTIRHLATLLACVVQDGDTNIQPSILGLETIYLNEWVVWQNAHRNNDYIPGLLGLSWESEAGDVGANPEFSPSVLTADVECLFTGCRPREEDIDQMYKRTALSKSGVCIYIDGLRALTCRPELMRRIHIIPGHIQRGVRRYESVFDGAGTQTGVRNVEEISFVTTTTASEAERLSVLPSLDFQDNSKLTISALVTERYDEDGITFYYKAVLPGKEASVVHLLPGALTEKILLGSGIVSCNPLTHNTSSREAELALPCAIVQRGWQVSWGVLPKLPCQVNLACVIWAKHREADLARCVIVESARYKGAEIFVRRGECLGCCTKEVLRVKPRVGLGTTVVFVI